MNFTLVTAISSLFYTFVVVHTLEHMSTMHGETMSNNKVHMVVMRPLPNFPNQKIKSTLLDLVACNKREREREREKKRGRREKKRERKMYQNVTTTFTR